MGDYQNDQEGCCSVSTLDCWSASPLCPPSSCCCPPSSSSDSSRLKQFQPRPSWPELCAPTGRLPGTFLNSFMPSLMRVLMEAMLVCAGHCRDRDWCGNLTWVSTYSSCMWVCLNDSRKADGCWLWLAVGGGISTLTLTNVPVVVLVVMEAGSLFTVSSHNTHPHCSKKLYRWN